MGRRGPPPMPEAMRKLRGRRHRKKEPGKAVTLSVGMPPMPPDVRENKIARDTWKRVSADLIAMEVLSPQHGYALGALCIAYARAREADELVKKYGLLITKRGRITQNPAVRMSTQWWKEVRSWSQEFGLTPASGTRLRVVSPEAKKQEKAKGSAEAFLFGGTGKVVGRISRTEVNDE